MNVINYPSTYVCMSVCVCMCCNCGGNILNKIKLNELKLNDGIDKILNYRILINKQIKKRNKSWVQFS